MLLKKDYKYFVYTFCATYNQSAYIVKTMDGFAMQKTDFPFVCVIADDASTDAEPSIIRDYLYEHFDMSDTAVAYEKQMDYGQVFYAQHKENKNCYFAVILLKENHYSQKKSRAPYVKEWTDPSKYFAYCEGDDYWTNPDKLQKQVDFLETHPDYNLVCHNWNILSNGKQRPALTHQKYANSFGFTFATLPWIWMTKTVTLMYRKAAVDEAALRQYQYARDVHLVYYALKDSKGYYMPEIMATYRVLDSGIWSKVDPNKKKFTTYALYKELYEHEPNKAVRKRYMNATLSYYNGLAFGKKTWWHFGTNAKLYFEALRNISDAKDVIFCLGGLAPTAVVQWVMKKFKI